MPRVRKFITALIPLPLYYNADRRGRRKHIEDAKLVATAEETARFLKEGGTLHVYRDARPRGFWWDNGIVDQDVHALLEIDFVDSPRNRRWVAEYARRVLLRRFRQKAIYVKFIGPIERLVVGQVIAKRTDQEVNP